MSADHPLQLFSIDVTPEPIPEQVPAAQDIFLVAGFWPRGGYWAVRRENWTNHDTAEHAAHDAAVAGWTNLSILHVRLGIAGDAPKIDS